ncbi:uncharacterized protein [Amphiura filiformis]|uniref:uncharacterized protein n=1 Tax=Amphiura filiformis TaxID=82378 RepID=UPI003B2240F5
MAGIEWEDLYSEGMLYADLTSLLEQKLQKYQAAAKPMKTWADRMNYEEENWESLRPQILSTLIGQQTPLQEQRCYECGSEASVRCQECPIEFLCHTCDINKHHTQRFHKREMWIGGFYQPIPNGKTVAIEDGEFILIQFDQYFPVYTDDYESCSSCGSGEFQIVQSGSTYYAVTIKGRFLAKKQHIKCNACNYIHNEREVVNLIQNGFWPGSRHRIKYIFSVELLEWISTLSKHMPGTSISAFAKAIQDIGQHDDVINKTVLTRVLMEFRYSCRKLELIQDYDSMKCPPCTISQQAAHVDGNFKVYRYSKVPRERKALHSGTFIVSDQSVQAHMDNVYPSRVQEPPNNTCGKTVWRAAKAQGKARANQDQTGLEVAGCRHALAQKACNMYTGEQYGYPHFLHVFILQPMGVRFLWQDVICRYWPWAKRRIDHREAVETMKPALSIMHSKAHSWDCQIKWGGRYQEGAGTGTGEEMEQFFSHLSRLGSTTKNMSMAGREDTLTEHVLFWNTRKIKSMASQLCRRYRRTTCELVSSEKQLYEYLTRLERSENSVKVWHQEIQQIARGDKNALESSELVEYFQLAQQAKEVKGLASFSGESTTEKSILLGNEELYLQAVKLCNQSKDKETRLLELTTKLKRETGLDDDAELYSESLNAATNKKLQELKAAIELIVVGIAQRKEVINRMSDSCKQKARLRTKNASEKNNLERLIKEYEAVQKLSRNAAQVCVLQDMLEGKFPWHTATVLHGNDPPVDMKKTVVDMYMYVQRCREELNLLKQDMLNYIAFYEQCTGGLMYSISSLETEIDTTEVDMVNTHMEMKYKKGELALKRKGLWFSKIQLQRGRDLFQKCLEDDWKSIECVLDEDELLEYDDSQEGDEHDEHIEESEVENSQKDDEHDKRNENSDS